MSGRPTISMPGETPMRSTVRARLEAPEETVDLALLAERWHDCEIKWTVEGLGKAIGDPGLPGRIRGAFGEALLASASPQATAGEPCAWDPPCGFEVLFRKQGRMEQGLDFPGPWVVELDTRSGNLLVTFRLFGFAADYEQSAAEALTYALRHKVDYAGRTGVYLPKPTVTHRMIRTGTEIELLGALNGMILDFRTPVTLTGNTVKQNPRGLITTAAARLAGLARWHDTALELDRETLVHATRQLDFEWIDAMPIQWQRGSSRQEKSFLMGGLVGRLVITGETADLELPSAILALGERTHIGADIAFGCGRYALTRF